MSTCTDRYEEVCRAQFAMLRAKLDAIDEAIRGNGKPGLNRRLDRLEVVSSVWARFGWLLVGAIVGVVARSLIGL